MRLKLGAQIGLGFGAVILIAAILGGLAIFNMSRVTTLSTQLAEEYAPEVDIAYRLDSAARETMYAMRGYAFTEDKKFLEQGREHLLKVDEEIVKAEALVAKSSHLDKLRGQIGAIEADFAEFRKLVDESEVVDDKTDAARGVLEEAAHSFMAQCGEYLDGQNKKLAKQFAKGAKAEKNMERLHKITVINDVIDLGNSVRIATWRAQAEREVRMIHEAQESFKPINAKLDELISLSTSAADVARLTAVKEAGTSYDKQMDVVAENWQMMQEPG